MKRLIRVLFLILLFSCRNDLNKVKGHWHSAYGNSQRYWTIDINDSTTIFELNNIERDDCFVFEHVYDNSQLLLPMIESVPLPYKIRNDTLFIGEYPFIKVINDWKDKQEDFFSNLFIKIELTQNEKSKPIYKVDFKSVIHFGKPKEYWLKYGSKNDFTLQVMDVLIDLSDLHLFVVQQLEINPEKNFILNLDQEVPKEKIDKIVEIILSVDSTINLYRTYINEQKQYLGILPYTKD